MKLERWRCSTCRNTADVYVNPSGYPSRVPYCPLCKSYGHKVRLTRDAEETAFVAAPHASVADRVAQLCSCDGPPLVAAARAFADHALNKPIKGLDGKFESAFEILVGEDEPVDLLLVARLMRAAYGQGYVDGAIDDDPPDPADAADTAAVLALLIP